MAGPLARLVRRHGRLKLVLAAGDVAAAAASAWWASRTLPAAPWIAAAWIALTALAVIPTLRWLDLYKYRVYAAPHALWNRVPVAALSLVLIAGLPVLAVRPGPPWCARLAVLLLAATAVMGGVRTIVARSLAYAAPSPLRRRVVLLTVGEEGARRASDLASHSPPDIDVVATQALNDRHPDGTSLTRSDVDEWMVVTGPMLHDELFTLLDRLLAQPVRISVSAPHYGIVASKGWEQEYLRLDRVPLNQGLASGLYRNALKPALDRVAAFVLLLLASPLLLVLALLVKLFSRGPVLYCAPAVGRDMAPFPMFKFRTMRTDADDAAHRALVGSALENPDARLSKLSRDPRVTPLGRILRRYSLDELPQLLNVLRGEMSLVGPRPSKLYEAERSAPWQRRRFQATPGITGLWQVSGRGEVSYNEMVVMDLFYGQNCSLWLDLTILLRTAAVVVRGTGGI